MILNQVNKHNVVDGELSSVVTLIPHSNTTTSILISMATPESTSDKIAPANDKNKTERLNATLMTIILAV